MKATLNSGCLFIGLTLILGLSAPAHSQQPQQQTVEPLEGYLATPEQLEFDEALLERLQLPDGFEINVFAQDLGNPRKLAVAPNGTVFVTLRDDGEVLALMDRNGDGRMDEKRTVASNVDYVNGIIVHENQLYFVTDTTLYSAALGADGMPAAPQVLIDDLPDAGQHPNRTLGFGPDGMLYISVGSTCNACDEPNDEHATLLRAQPDGSNREIYAEGLRNTIGFTWHPETSELWGMDHGSDWRGNDSPPEELNRIAPGEHYGWPFCWGDRQPDVYLPAEPDSMTKEEFCATTQPPVLTYQAHSAPLDMLFYNASQFPQEYQGDAFVTMRGSWNRQPPVGYEVVRIRFENGQPVAFEDFVTGFLTEDGSAQFGRPVGMATLPDGSLLFTDDTNGVIYRVAYTGEDNAPAR
ncbi:sorbosone dehydrogenase family protein [Oculatella sp. LEGE 06141]|uniref:PQQ-dependent sugar dehydrogenase n=1 Tax=Oculatella sp. LEGE 06141 TaxID=1828648 RepID=UPI00187F6419|nr:sorbosone dehydrogenase family protein [Oculatella sp. LEGE 06141]MBE9177319.1 sorbosone dehydrogenase family protein [Oculatella sp. LEGE 06141]